MRVSLKAKRVADKLCLLIPSYYHDLFIPGKKYGVFTCSEIARYRVLLVPTYLTDLYQEDRYYVIDLPT